MAFKNAFLDGRWVPSDARITYQNFNHWEAAMRQSHEMAQTQADGQQLRHLWGPASPTFTPQTGFDKQSDNVYETNPDAIVFRLARNRPALDALRRTRKIRYRHNLKFLAASFPLADEAAKKDKQAKQEAEKEKAQGLTTAEILAQKELAKKKNVEKTIEELKYIREMKAAKTKAAASERLKEKEAKNGTTSKEAEKATGKSAKETPAKKVVTAARKSAQKATKSAEKEVQKTFCPQPPNMFAMPAQKKAKKSAEEDTGETAEKRGKRAEKAAPETVQNRAPKSTGEPRVTKSAGKSLRAKMMPKVKRW